MKNKVSNLAFLGKFFWSCALLVDVIVTIEAIISENILACIVVILFSIFIARFGDPAIFKKHNQRRKVQAQRANENIRIYRKEKNDD